MDYSWLAPVRDAAMTAAAGFVTAAAGAVIAMVPGWIRSLRLGIHNTNLNIIQFAIDNAAQNAVTDYAVSKVTLEGAIGIMVEYVTKNCPKAIAATNLPPDTLWQMCSAAFYRVQAARQNTPQS